MNVHRSGFAKPGRCLTALDEDDLVAGCVKTDVVHHRADQQQATAADAAEVLRVGWVRERSGVKAGALVADGERCLGARDAHVERNAALSVGRLLASLLPELLVDSLVVLSQFRIELE